MKILWQTEESTLGFDPSTCLLYLVRSNHRSSIEEINRFRIELPVLLGRAGLMINGLMIDMREVVGRNDDQFEEASAKLLLDLAKYVPRIAVLVSSTTGRMQVQRHNRLFKIPIQGFSDESAALEFLRSGQVR